MTFEEWVPSILTMVGLGGASIFGYGRLIGRVNALELRQKELADAVEKVGEIRESVATIEERTKNTAESVRDQSQDLRKLTGYIMDEDRSFAREIVRNQRQLPQG